jgi:hypothetical protein
MKIFVSSLLLSSASLAGFANAFTVPLGPSRTYVDTTSLFASIGLYYSTSTGNTETVAGYIAEAIGAGVQAEDIGDVSGDEALKHDALIVGSPTWITGADKQRSGTEWDTWLYSTLPKLDMYVLYVGFAYERSISHGGILRLVLLTSCVFLLYFFYH